MFPGLGQGFLRDTVGFKIQNGDAVRLQQGAVHHALEQHPLAFQSFAVLFPAVQDGELEFPQIGAAGTELPSDFRIKKAEEHPGPDHLPLVLRQKTGGHQAADFRPHGGFVGAGFVMDELHGAVDGVAVGGAPPGRFPEGGLAPGLLIRPPGGVLLGFLVPGPALSAGDGLLGGGLGGGLMGIPEGKAPPQPRDAFRWEGRLRVGFRDGLLPGHRVGLHQADDPGIVAHHQGFRPSAKLVQRPGLHTLHGRRQDPVAVAVCFGADQGFPPGAQTIRQLCQFLLGIFQGAGHHQPVHGPGHGDVQDPQLLADPFGGDGGGDGPLGKGAVAQPVLVVRHRQAQAQVLVAEHRLVDIAEVEPVGQAAEEHHREFQALGLVDAHQPDAPGAAAASRHRAAPEGFQLVQKLVQGARAPLFKIHRQLVEGLQILPLGLPPGHGGIDAVQPGQPEAGLQQSRQGFQPGLFAKHLKNIQKFPCFWAIALQKGVINSNLLAPPAQGGQVIGGEAEDGAGQHRQQGDVLPGVLDGLQQGDENANLLGIHQVGVPLHGAADAPGLQRPAEGIAHGAGGAKQNDDILGCHRPQGASLANGGAFCQHFFNAPGCKVRFLVVGFAAGNLQYIKFRGRVLQGAAGNSLPQCFRLAVVQAAHLPAHAGGEHLVDGGDHLDPGAEIVAEENFPPLARLCLLSREEAAVFFQEDARVCQPEAVDGLLHVPHHKAILLLLGQGGKDGVLDAVGILVFVHHHFPVAAAQFPCCRRGAGAFLSQQQVQRPVLQIPEIQNPAAAFQGGVVGVEPAHQLNEPPGRVSGGTQVGEHLPGIVGEAAELLFQLLLAALPDGLHLFGQHRVIFLPRKAQGAEIHIFSLSNLIPGLALPEEFQLGDEGGKARHGLFHPSVPFQPGQQPAQHRQHPIQPGKEVLHEIPSPNGLPGVGDAFQGGVFQAVIQPFVRVLVAPGAVVDLENDLRHRGVVPAHPLGIHKIPEMARLVLIGPVQQVTQHGGAKLGAFRLLRHPEIRGQVHTVGILPQNRRTEAVDRGDLGQVEPLELLLQMLVFRLPGDALGEFCGDLSPQLRGRRLGIGDHQKIIQVGRGDWVRQIGQQPLHQDLCFAGTGGGADQQLPAPIDYRLFLLVCQLICHGFPAPFPPPPRIPGRSWPCNSAARAPGHCGRRCHRGRTGRHRDLPPGYRGWAPHSPRRCPPPAWPAPGRRILPAGLAAAGPPGPL